MIIRDVLIVEIQNESRRTAPGDLIGDPEYTKIVDRQDFRIVDCCACVGRTALVCVHYRNYCSFLSTRPALPQGQAAVSLWNRSRVSLTPVTEDFNRLRKLFER